MRVERTYVNSPTREAALYDARGAARDWGVLRMRLADVASEDVLGRPRFLTVPVPRGLGPDAGFSGCEEDVAGVGEAERDEVGEADSGEETSTPPFLDAESDSISSESESESSIASLGGECGRVGGALGDTISACLGAVGVFPAAVGVFPAAVGVFPAAVGVFPVAVGVFPVVVGIFLVAVGRFTAAADAIGADLDGLGAALEGNFVA